MSEQKHQSSLSTQNSNQPQAPTADESSSLVPSLSMMNKEINQSSRDIYTASSWRDLLNFLKRRWVIITGVTASITIALVWWMFHQSPIYQGKFMLLLEKQQNLPQPSSDELANDSLNQIPLPNNPQVDYSTEVQILGSAGVLAPILQEIQSQYPDIYEDINLGDLNDLEIRQLEQTKIIEVVFEDEDSEKVKFVLDKIAQTYGSEDFDPLESDTSQGLKFVQEQVAEMESKVKNLQKKLQGFRQKHQLLDPLVTSRELTQRALETEREFFTVQIDLQQANSTYQRLQQQLKLTPEQAIVSTSLSESPLYQDLLKQLQAIDVEIAEQSVVYTEQSPPIITLKEKRANIVKLIAAEKQKLTSSSAGGSANLTTLDNPNSIRSKLTEQLLAKENEIASLKIKQTNLQQTLGQLRAKISQMPEITNEYTNLQRELTASTDSLNRLLETKDKLEIEDAQNQIDWQIISPTQISKLSAALPFSYQNLALVFLLGLSVGTVCAIVVDRFDNSLHSINQLKKVTNLPILGSIPFDKNFKKGQYSRNSSFLLGSKIQSSSKLLPEQDSSWWMQSFNNLYANISFLQNNNNVQKPHSLVISSVNPASGKTTISFHLAKAVAAMGKKVLLVDLNLRLPKIHQLLGIENAYGLGEVLTEQIELSSAIQSLPQWGNLSILTMGKLPLDPTSLLLSPKTRELIEEISKIQEFDLVIFDSASLLGLLDAQVISAHADGLILVVMLEKTKTDALQQVIEQMRISKMPVVGMVANGVPRNSQEINYQSQSHDYYQSQQVKNESLFSDVKKL